MPKLKTKSGAKKRFKMTASGLVKAGKAVKRHRFISKTSRQKRAKGMLVLSDRDTARVKMWMPYDR
ncbi:MAG TPA: 50S ribosomal protein L35 [Alphaproteobacteria bacterium]|nr:50S ribosomal protein L35 [Alphaproteobacteria bacterium]HAJ48173.1 50S ribosomal protein L35 [Alphaproteobacteria bacterium]